MYVGINPITNSPQKMQQNHQSFGAFTYTQPTKKLRPIIKKAQELDITLLTPKMVVAFIKSLNSTLLDKNSEKTVMSMLKGHLLVGVEYQQMTKAASTGGVDGLIKTVKNLITGANPLPEGIKQCINAMKKAKTKSIKNGRKIQAAQEQQGELSRGLRKNREFLSSFGI